MSLSAPAALERPGAGAEGALRHGRDLRPSPTASPALLSALDRGERPMADQTIRIAADHVPDARRALMHIYSGIADALQGAAAEMAIRSGDQDATRGHRLELADAGDALDQIGWEFIAA